MARTTIPKTVQKNDTLSNTLKYINLTGLGIGLVVLRGPMHLCTCVSEDRGPGTGRVRDHQCYQIHLRYINLGLDITLVVYCEEIKRELQRILIYECRCNERLET